MASISEIARKEALIRRLAEARGVVGERVVGVQRMLDVPARATAAIRRNPLALVGASVALGLVFSLLRRKRGAAVIHERAPRRTLKRQVVSMAGGMLKTAVKGIVLERIAKTLAPPPPTPRR